MAKTQRKTAPASKPAPPAILMDQIDADLEENKEHTLGWNANHVLIKGAYMEIFEKQQRRPTAAEIAEATGISLTTVNRHLANLRFDPQAAEFRQLSSDVLMALHRTAVKHGRAAEVKLWFQIVEGMKFTEDEANKKIVVDKAVITIVTPENAAAVLPREQTDQDSTVFGFTG